IEPKVAFRKVNNGKAVIEYLEQLGVNDLPCLIILDYNMPELTGSEVLAIICKEKKYENIPKIVFSTSGTTAYINECMKNGATEYFVKPDNLMALATIAKKILTLCKIN
ncbi:MAG TPA: response regulator, partial [Flavitalea sp.]|nr:response regulator [Flavitalea sp.]